MSSMLPGTSQYMSRTLPIVIVQFSAGIAADSKETLPSEGMLSDALTDAVRVIAARAAMAITMIFFMFVCFTVKHRPSYGPHQ